MKLNKLDNAKLKIEALGIGIVEENKTMLRFSFKGQAVTFYPYSSLASGATIKNCRGLQNLLKQIKPVKVNPLHKYRRIDARELGL